MLLRLVFRLIVAGVVLAVIVAVGIAGIDSEAPAGLPTDKVLLDLHTHVAGLGFGGSGCFVAPELADSYKFRWYLRAFGTNVEEMRHAGDDIVADKLAAKIRESRWIARAVVLALDGVVDADGRFDHGATQIYVPNDFVARTAARYDNLEFGASVNPYRTDALALLTEAKANGAVLVKWVPAIMAIDPGDPGLADFYRKLVELELPLLVHVGEEHAFHHADNRLADPGKLKLPLHLGVTVIAAHFATLGESGGAENFSRLLDMLPAHPNLYADISSLTQANKLGYLTRALTNAAAKERMLYGSDWPLQFFPLVSPWYHVGAAPLGQLKFAAAQANAFDRDIALKAALGIPLSGFTRAGEMIVAR